MNIKIGDRVLTVITAKEGTVVALTDDTGPEPKVKVRFDGFWKHERWWFASMLKKIITEKLK